MIEFLKDDDVEELRHNESAGDLATLLSLLCGQEIRLNEFSLEAKSAIDAIIDRNKKSKPGLSLKYEEFNELLLLFNQHRVERPFFEFFFLNRQLGKASRESSRSDLEEAVRFTDLTRGIRKFRGFAMLCFGNFRFAFRDLSRVADSDQFWDRLDPWNLDSDLEEQTIKNRSEPLVRLHGSEDVIGREHTWYLGYLSSELLNNDAALVRAIAGRIKNLSLGQVLKDQVPPISEKIKQIWDSLTRERSEEFKAQIDQLESGINKMTSDGTEARARGLRNTIKYLTWDYLDVYVATSMRQQWEFQETHDFLTELFGRHLKDLPLRWFDPTQSYDDSVIDKGILEGLMLKRAKCTIYMAQEVDTLGKDSELAATLAQGKPVIAYVRNVDPKKEPDRLKERPLRYFRQRLLNLLADAFFERTDNRLKVIQLAQEVGPTLTEEQIKQNVKEFLEFLDGFESRRTFRLIGGEEDAFRNEQKDKVEALIKFLSAIEVVAANNRADTIKSKHPLAMQVHLERGVANGVLVARDIAQCAKLVRGIATREMNFRIEPLRTPRKRLGTVLLEDGTGSRFRYVTASECLTNSFWNFYLT